MTKKEGPDGPADGADQKAVRLIAEAATTLPVIEDVQALHRRATMALERAADDLGIPPVPNVPRGIRLAAASRYRFLMDRGDQNGAAVALRLASHNRMWPIWKNLTRRRSRDSDRSYFFAAKTEKDGVDLGPALIKAGIDPRFTAQDRAAYFFFEAALRAATAPTQFPTKGELTRKAARAEKLVETIDKAVHELAQLSDWPGPPETMAAVVIEAMETAKELRAQAIVTTRKRHRTDAKIYGFVVTVHREIRRLYGGDLAGIIAATGNAALDLSEGDTLTDVKVRKILDGIK